MATSPARSCSAACSTLDRRAAEERQDDPLVPGRRRGRQRHRRAAGHRLRREQLRGRRPRRRGAPGGRAPRRLRDQRPQDLRPRLRGDDLLDPRARHRRGPRRHPGAPLRRRCAGRRRVRRAAPARRRHRDGDQPRPRVRPLAARRRPRGRARLRRRRSPTRPTARSRPPNGDGYPVVVDDPDGCPVFVARTVTGFDPAAPTPGWLARRIQLAGMRPISLAVDVTNYVMLEIGRPIHGYDVDKLRGPIGVRRAHGGRAAHHARRRRPGAVRRGPGRHRRLRAHRPRRRDGRRDHRDVARPPPTS